LDANETAVILPVLIEVYGNEHTFRTASQEKLAGEDDIPLFAELHRRDFGAIITRDRNQLRDPDERTALREANLHWIGHKEPKTQGLDIISTLGAGYLAAFPHVLKGLEAAEGPLHSGW
jgi:hypothetical protein